MKNHRLHPGWVVLGVINGLAAAGACALLFLPPSARGRLSFRRRGR